MKKMRRRAAGTDSGGEQGFWPSYTDMMSAVALILFFLMLLAYIQNIITNNDLMHKEEELKDTLAQLSLAAAQVEDKEKELSKVSTEAVLIGNLVALINDNNIPMGLFEPRTETTVIL